MRSKRKLKKQTNYLIKSPPKPPYILFLLLNSATVGDTHASPIPDFILGIRPSNYLFSPLSSLDAFVFPPFMIRRDIQLVIYVLYLPSYNLT